MHRLNNGLSKAMASRLRWKRTIDNSQRKTCNARKEIKHTYIKNDTSDNLSQNLNTLCHYIFWNVLQSPSCLTLYVQITCSNKELDMYYINICDNYQTIHSPIVSFWCSYDIDMQRREPASLALSPFATLPVGTRCSWHLSSSSLFRDRVT